MNYLMPTWRDNLHDWSTSTPHLVFDDSLGQLRLLEANQQPVGLLIVNYQPHLLEQLTQQSLTPQRILSVYDYIQGVHRFTGQVLSYDDFTWPTGSSLEMDPFQIIVHTRDGRCYAKLFFSTTSRLISIDFFDERGEQRTKTWLIDSRGFVSSEIDYDGDKQTQQRFFDESGNWRIKHDLQSDAVVVNPLFQDCFAQSSYSHLADLVTEVVLRQLIPEIEDGDNRLVVSLDDQQVVLPETVFNRVPTVFSLSRWHNYQAVLQQLQTPQQDTLVADTTTTAVDVATKLNLSVQPTVIPLFYSQFRLGHSQRTAAQQIAVFNENMDVQSLMDLVMKIFPRLLKNHKTEQLFMINYSEAKQQEAQYVLDQLVANFGGQFLLHSDQMSPIEIKLAAADKRPELVIKVVRLASINDALKFLDKVRLMIDLGDLPDEFLQMAAVSIGIPRLQKMATPQLQDHQNGLVVKDLDGVMDGISYYLDNLKHWNVALASAVQLMNKYSSQQMYDRWQSLWKQGEK